jgi:hypothetical protein
MYYQEGGQCSPSQDFSQLFLMLKKLSKQAKHQNQNKRTTSTLFITVVAEW